MNYSINVLEINMTTGARNLSNGYLRINITGVYDNNQSVRFRLLETFNTTSKPLNNTQSTSYSGYPDLPAFSTMEVQALGNGTFGDLLNKTPRSHAIPGNLAGVSEAKVRIGNRGMTTYLVKFQDSLPQRSIFNLSYWVDPDSGLIVKATEEGPFPALYFNYLYDNFTLKSTNIISLSGSSDLFIVAIGVAAATAAIAIMPVIYMQRSGSHKKTEDTGDQEDLPEGSISGESRIEELNALLEKGVIEKEFYDESVRRLRRRR